MFTYATKEANHPRVVDQLSSPPMGLPFGFPILMWPKGYPTLAWPINYPTLAWSPIRDSLAYRWGVPTFIWPINITNRLILNHMVNQVVLPWPLYISDLPAFGLNTIQTDSLDLVVSQANHQSSELDKTYHSNHKIDLAVDGVLNQSSEQVTSVCHSHNHDWIRSLLSEQIVKQNMVTDVKVTEDTITVYISPIISATYVRQDCKNPTTVNRYDSKPITVQGLG